MKKEDLSDAMGEIDKEIIDEAAEKRKKVAALPKRKPVFAWVAGLTAAAAAISAVVIVPRLNGGQVGTGGETSAVTVSETAPPETEETPAASTAVSSVTETTAGIGSGPEKGNSSFDRSRPESAIVAGVSAVNMVGDFIASDSMLKIDVKGDVSEETLRSHISLNGGGEFTLHRSEDSSYLLSAAERFPLGDTVRLTVSDDSGNVCDSYAFASMNEFLIKSVYPGDMSDSAGTLAGVEIQFTGDPDITRAEEYFEISPPTEGTFTKARNTLIFRHDEPFMADTRYTVTLKSGFPACDGQLLKESRTFSFTTRTEYSDTYFYTGSSGSGFSESFIPGDRACVEIYCSGSLKKREYELHLYSFGSSEDYYKAVQAHTQGVNTVETNGLTEVYSSFEKPFVREDDDSSVYVLLPEELAEGFYVADISVTGMSDIKYSLQYMVAVTPLSVYSLSLGEENLFYVNDPQTGKPAAGASVTLDISGKKYSGRVGADGLVKITTGGERGRAVVDIRSSGGRYIDAYLLSDAEDVKYDDLYYTYLYTDREQYLTTDTVRVWGVILPRARGTALPSDLSIGLGDYWLRDGEKKPVTVAKDGTFSAEFTFKNHTGSYDDVYLQSGDDIIIYKSVGIFDYTKPDYVLDVSVPEYVVLPQYEPFTADITATYYEGTPAAGLEFSVENGTPYLVTTDAEGHASSQIRPSGDGQDDWREGYAYADVSLSGIEDVYIYGYRHIPAFYRDVMLRYALDDKNNLVLLTNKLDFSKADEYFAKKDTDEYRDKSAYLILKGEPTETEISVRITHEWTEAEETGSYYDYIEKKTVRQYRYTLQSTQVAAYRLTTEEGKFALRSLPFVADHGVYTVYMTYSDTHGQPVEMQFSVVKSDNDRSSYFVTDEGLYVEKGSHQTFFSLSPGTQMRTAMEYAAYHSFSEDEEVAFTLKCSDEEKTLDGKLLLAVYRSDIVEYKLYDLSENGDILYRTTKDCIPDVRFEGAYFDGRHIYKVFGGSLFYDPSERGLNIEASSDRPKYDAGETAKIAVKATDREGNAVSGATVHLSVVDEAAFAVADQYADILGDLYSYINYPSAISAVSYIQHFYSTAYGGEKGGGGGSGTRRDFRDTVYFGSAVTSADGTAVFTVKLSDDLTTWRATVFAMYDAPDSRLLAGTKLLPVVVSRSVMIDPIMQTTYVEGDDIAVSANCAGMPADGSITVHIAGGSVNKGITIKPKDTANFGKLPAGKYTVTFTADGDAVEMPLTVTDSLLETKIVRGFDAADLQSGISPTRYPVTVTFFDKEYLFSTQVLRKLAFYYGDNLGMRFAAAYAEMKLGFITEQEFIDEFLPETTSTLAKALPAASPDIELTALMCAAYPDAVNRDKVIPVFTSYIDSLADDTDECAVLMGLAALGEPVLDEVREKLASDTGYRNVGGIYLSAALAFCGDYSGAYDAYIKYVPDITVNDSDPDAVTAYAAVKYGDAQVNTRAALITASLLDLPEAEYFVRYISKYKVSNDSYGLQFVTYLENYVPEVKGEAVFTYNRDGETHEVKLDRHYPTVLTFTEKQLSEAGLCVTSGAVYAVAGYTGRVDENEKTPTVSVTKTVTGNCTAGEKVTVTVKGAPDSVIYDVIPSCGRLYKTPGRYYRTNGQQIILYTNRYGEATYQFIPNVTGEFVLESAVSVAGSGEEWGLSERSTIKVNNAQNDT